MYDTIFLTLSKDQAQVDFLAESACALSQVGEHYFGNDAEPKVTGYLDNLRVFVSANSLTIKGGSLAKYYFGNNYQTLKRSDTKMAIERLSDELHLPMSKAKVTRLDIGTTFIMKHPVDVYYNHLGTLAYSGRLAEPDGLYYAQNDRRLVFYDKNREQRNNGEAVPELYRGKNVLRYEHRHLHRLPSRLGVPEVTASMLYDKDFYKAVVHRWADTYKDIKKINDIELNTDIMKTKGDLKMAGVLRVLYSQAEKTSMPGRR